MIDCYDCDFVIVIGNLLVQVVCRLSQLDQHAESFLLNEIFIQSNDFSNIEGFFRLKKFLPNLSRTDGPGGGGCDCIGCLLDSYRDGYETGACDEDDDAPYCDCFGKFITSS